MYRFKILLSKALENGYRPGEFAIGGAYIIRYEVLKKLEELGLLQNSPFHNI